MNKIKKIIKKSQTKSTFKKSTNKNPIFNPPSINLDDDQEEEEEQQQSKKSLKEEDDEEEQHDKKYLEEDEEEEELKTKIISKSKTKITRKSKGKRKGGKKLFKKPKLENKKEKGSPEIKLTFQVHKKPIRNKKYFVYREKQYEVDFELLKINSEYFYNNLNTLNALIF